MNRLNLNWFILMQWNPSLVTKRSVLCDLHPVSPFIRSSRSDQTRDFICLKCYIQVWPMTEANQLMLCELGAQVPKWLYYPTIQLCPEVINLRSSTECGMPVWNDILTPIYIDPGVNISYDILTPGSIYRNDIWPPSRYFDPLLIMYKSVLLVMNNY